MKAASLAEIKKRLVKLEQGEILEACLRLARFKRDNKELLTYLLFASENEKTYVASLCNEIDDMFAGINKSSLYFAKKGIRKTIRWMEKFIRYSGNQETEIEVRIHFCKALHASKIPVEKSKVTTNMLQSQLKKIDKALASFHPDIQYEYRQEIDRIIEEFKGFKRA